MSSRHNANTGTTPEESWAQQTLNQLSTEEKVGQLIMPAFRGAYLHDASPEFKEIQRQIEKNHVGGFILFAGDVYESAALIDRMQRMTKVPLLIASDFERGANFRIRGTTSFPWNMAIGATSSEQWAAAQGKITAQEARAIGVNWVFAPVLDVNSNPANPVVNIRSYGEDPALVGRLGSAFVRAVQEGGVLATGKHFPGHGDTNVDSHLDIPLISGDRQRLEQVDLVPFRMAIQSGVGAMMTAHVAVPALEPNVGLPATLSPLVLHTVLQQELGFSGLVVTDSLTMSGLARDFWTGDAAVKAFNAGADMLLDPPNPDVVYAAILEAVKAGVISQERLDGAVVKILNTKARLHLPEEMRVDLSGISRVVNSPENQQVAQGMADASVTLLRDPKNLLPIDARKIRSVKVFLVLSRDQQEDTAIFQQEFRARMEDVSFEVISTAATDSHLTQIFNKAKQQDLLLCAVFARLVTGTGSIGLPEKLAGWINRVCSLDRPTVVLALGSPYVLRQFPNPPASICTYSNADVSQRSAVKALFGEIPIKGKSPVSIPGVARYSDGIDRPRLDMTLVSAQGTQWGDRFKSLDLLMKESIGKHVFPGGTVAVGYRDQLVYNKAFGHFEYDSNSPLAANDTLFDLASLSKVVCTTTLAMHLFEKGLLDLEYPVKRFYPGFDGGGKERITIRHLLTHSSGLPAHLHFYRDTQGKAAFVQKIIQTPLEFQPGTKAVYSDLGIILLGDILEKLAGKPIDVMGRELIFEPLQMKHTLFNPLPEIKGAIAPTERDPWRGRLVQGEVHDENAFAMGGIAPHAGLFSNTGDLAVFCQMLLNGGVYDHHRIVKQSTLEAFLTRQNMPPGSSRALGWDTPSEGSSAGILFSDRSFGHTGFTGTSMWMDPSRQLFVILLTNRVYPTRENNGIQEVRREVADAVVKAVEGEQ